MAPVNYPLSIEGRIGVKVRNLFREVWRKRAEEIEANMRRDDSADKRLFDALEADLKAAISGARPAFNSLHNDIYQHGQVQFGKLFKAEFGAEARFTEPWAQGMINEATDDLIERLHGTAGAFTQNVKRAHIQARKNQKGTIGPAREATRKYKKKALRDASFHVRNVSGQLLHDTTFKRFDDFDIDEYIWITRLDRRVRGNPAGLYPNSRHDHWERHGEIYKTNHKHSDGRPGEPEACRCSAQPKFPDYGRKKGKLPAWLLGILAGAAYEAMREEEKAS